MNGVHGRLLVAPLLGLLLLGCRANRPDAEVDRAYPDASVYAPDWRSQPLGWSKLDRIETWLVGPGPAHFPQEVPVAELELAEGRLELARRDAQKLERKMLDLRLASAEAGFRRVLGDPHGSALLRSRAQAGLEAMRDLRSGTTCAPAADPVLAQVLPRARWGAAPAVPAHLTRNTQPWKRITVHHSARLTSEIGGTSLAASAETIRKIQLVHMRDRAFGDIGYHFLIDPAGRIFQGRALEWQGAHSEGSNNVANIGVCLLGDFDHERPAPAALKALESLLGALARANSIPASAIKGHAQFKPTDCPGTYLMAWVRAYAAGTRLATASAPRMAAASSTGPARMR